MSIKLLSNSLDVWYWKKVDHTSSSPSIDFFSDSTFRTKCHFSEFFWVNSSSMYVFISSRTEKKKTVMSKRVSSSDSIRIVLNTFRDSTCLLGFLTDSRPFYGNEWLMLLMMSFFMVHQIRFGRKFLCTVLAITHFIVSYCVL